MRKYQQEITDRQDLDDILERALVCRIGLSDGNTPYIVPVCFEVEVDVEVLPGEPACKWTTKYKSVIGFGAASIVEDRDEKIYALNVIMDHYSADGSYDYEPHALDLAAIIKIEITSMSGKRSKA